MFFNMFIIFSLCNEITLIKEKIAIFVVKKKLLLKLMRDDQRLHMQATSPHSPTYKKNN